METRHNLLIGWANATLGDLLTVLRGVSYKKEEAHYNPVDGLVPILRANSIDNGHLVFDDLVYVPQRYVSDEQLLHPCDIVVAASSGSSSVVGKAAPLRTEWFGSFGAFCFGLRPSQHVNAMLVAYYLQTTEYRNRVSELASGVNINNLRRHHIEDTPFRLPPFNEQHRIVDEIEKQFSRLDEAVANLKRVQANLKRYRASVLQAACSGKLVPTEADLARQEKRNFEPASELLKRILVERRQKWEENELTKMQVNGKEPKDDKWKRRYKEPATPDTTNLPELPVGWCWISIGQLAWSVKDGPHFSPPYVDDGIPFITGGNVRPDAVDFDNARRISPELHQEFSKRCKPELGDILYTKGGTTGIARVNTYTREFNVWVHVAVIKLSGPIESFYIQHALNAPTGYKQAQKYTHGVGNQDLGLTRLVNIVVGLPPVAEQRRIVSEVDRHLSVINRMEVAVEMNLKRTERLRQAILKRAFEGNLVPQDPNNEPACVLLERIKAERAQREQEERAERAKRPKKRRTVAMATDQRRPLWDLLQEVKQQLTPEELFRRSGFSTSDDVDEFYKELREQVSQGRIIEHRPNNADILLEASKG